MASTAVAGAVPFVELVALVLLPLLGCARAVPVRGRPSTEGGAGPEEEEDAEEEEAEEAFFFLVAC